VTFADGTVEPYDALILATGSTARRLAIPGADRPDLMELRTLADAERLKAALGPGRRLAIVGGGYVGLEAAASARALGAGAVVIERMDRVLARVASETLSTFFTARHRSEGVEILTGAEVTAFEDGGVRLADGRLIEADAVLVGVGAVACDDPGAGGRVWPAGTAWSWTSMRGPRTRDLGHRRRDLPAHPVHGGRRHRLESVPNALEQAKQAASAIVGRAAPAPEVPWFWSDQYDLKLQIAGLPDGPTVRSCAAIRA
jgi:3-phenylpropionate/trans-cinnamate dioxygenase ferredoxin reductase subunit